MRVTWRRISILAFALVGCAALFLLATVFRLYQPANTFPYLTKEHLETVQLSHARAGGDLPQVLFIGNSALVRHDVPSLVVQAAERSGRPISASIAAANGVRLVQVARIPGLKQLLSDVEWDAVVLQEFSRTALSPMDAWVSRRTIRNLAALADGAEIIVMPHWPSAANHPVYEGELGWLEATPASPEDWLARNRRLFGVLSEDMGAALVPTEDAIKSVSQNGSSFYADDLHHANADGAKAVADVIWFTLAPLLDQR